MRLSEVARILSRHHLLALVIVLVAVLTGLGLGTLLGDRGSTAVAPSDEPLPTATQTAEPSEAASPTPMSNPTPLPSGSEPTPSPVVCVQLDPSAPKAELVPGSIALIRVDELRVRSGPGPACEAIDTFRAGETVAIVAGPFSVDGLDWYEVRQGPGDRGGFVSGGPADGDPWLVGIGNGSIAILRTTSWETYSLDRMEPDGSNLVTTHATLEGSGRMAWSPDGQRIAFHIHQAGEWHISVADADGGGDVHLGAGDDPAWSPDGSMLAFARAETDGVSLMITRHDGADMRRLSYGWLPAWSPNGSRIAVVRWGGALDEGGEGIAPTPVSLWSIEVGTGLETRVTPDELVNWSRPSWSPDGTMLTYGNRLLGANGSVLMSLEPGTEWAGPVPWSPDGEELAIVSQDGSVLELLTVDTGERRRVTTAAPGWGNIGHATWSPDGRRLAYKMVTGDYADWRIYVIDLQEGDPVQIGPPFSQFPAWQPVVSHGFE